VHLAVGKVEALRGLVGQQAFFDLGDRKPFAGGAALVQTEIAVGVERALVPEYADLVLSGEDDPAVAVLEFLYPRANFLFLGPHPVRAAVLKSGVHCHLYNTNV
jgi:hypothetical protein